ncbi:MAG TPA: hypothetical protein VIF60_03205 [Burkholderiaceae bacterium]
MALSALLAQQTPPLKKGAKITLTVSDTVAAITTLPWQEGLRKEDELHSYAQVYFEKLGIKIDHQWVLHVEFRHYGATGLAYAFPKSWLETIVAVADEKKVDIETILPISAAACSRVKLSSKSGLFLLLLHEKTHLAALVYRDGNLIARDVEPIAQFADESCNRLMLRVKGAHEGAHESAGNIMDEIAYWSYNLQAPPAALVESIFPGVKIVAVGYRDWE